MKQVPVFVFLFLSVLILFSCKKIPADAGSTAAAEKSAGTLANLSAPPSTGYIDSFDAVNHDGDTTERMTQLGSRLTNPYLVPNMQQAYANLGITNVSVTVTNKYVRFKPTVSQVSYLDSFMDAKGVEMYDIPLDYQVLLEGDYYQDPSIPAEQPTWQYAVVPNVFTYPSGVTYETLAQIHIPADNYTAVETEAERLAAASGGGLNTTDGGAEPNVVQCLQGYHWDYEEKTCVPNNCPTDYHWDGTQCVPDQTSPNPPAPAPDAAVPAGRITIDETQNIAGTDAGTTANPSTGTNNRLAPLRNARIIARRWFKVERVQTNNNGQFQCSRRFKNKVSITVRFKNGDATLKCLRGARVWNAKLPLGRMIGVYNTSKNNVTYNFAQFDHRRARGNVYWVGGTVHNALQEYRNELAPGQGIGLPPTKMNILLTNWASNASTPMLHQRWSNYLPDESIRAWVVNDPTGITGGLPAVLQAVGFDADMFYGFRVDPGVSFFTRRSDELKEAAYHELTHAGHYSRLGINWYSQFVNAEISAIAQNVFNSQFSPYGNGTASYSSIIALGESWAYYMGHVMADARYGVISSCQREQVGGNTYCSDPFDRHNTHIEVLEGFNPNLTSDPFRWIPQGLYQDLRDDATETTPVTDKVNGYYTSAIMFNAFTSGITTMQGYRTNLLNQNGNNQMSDVTALFTQYHY